jgi:hypothetical protein
MSYPNTAIAHSAAPAARIAQRGISAQAESSAQPPADWQARAISSYRQAQRHALIMLPELLATRVAALTGRTIAPEEIFVDPDAEIATVVVDGVVFRAHDQQVVLLRSCAECGIERFESRPLRSRASLGYALSTWQPLCHNCQPEDPANWLEN